MLTARGTSPYMPGKGEAALLADLLALGGEDLGVEDHLLLAGLARGADEHQPPRDADLGRGEADAAELEHDAAHLADDLAQLVVDLLDRIGALEEDGMGPEDDLEVPWWRRVYRLPAGRSRRDARGTPAA